MPATPDERQDAGSCPRCDATLPAGSTACSRCWAHDRAAPWATSWQPPAQRRSGRAGWVVAAALAVALVAMTALAGTLWMRDADPAVAAGPRATALSAPLSGGASDDVSRVYSRVEGGVGKVVVLDCDDDPVSGSGFLVATDEMVTAAHVVADASRVDVELDGVSVPARVIGIDDEHDLALLRLDTAVQAHVFRFARRAPGPGARLAAIGYPMGEPKTLTVGTVSGLDRDVTTDSGHYEGLLQTDTAINPGSSGGPMLDSRGRVAAVADAMRQDAQGIGFAIPAQTARASVREMRAAPTESDCG